MSAGDLRHELRIDPAAKLLPSAFAEARYVLHERPSGLSPYADPPNHRTLRIETFRAPSCIDFDIFARAKLHESWILCARPTTHVEFVSRHVRVDDSAPCLGRVGLNNRRENDQSSEKETFHYRT